MKLSNLVAVATATALLAACGGGAESPDRGSLAEAPATLATLTAAQIDAGTTANGLNALTGAAKCDVKVVALNYNTVGLFGEDTNASGVMLVPVSSATCPTANEPLLAYAKGTDVQKPRTLANPSDSETFLLIAMYAAQGYVVVASDFLGYAKSSYTFHPYLHANSEALTMIDSVRAARNAAQTVGATLSGKVMLTGYSQGGHSSMAAHRAAERDLPSEMNVVAGAHLAGPYNLSGSFKTGVAVAGYQFFVPFLVTSYQKIYGNAYPDVNAAFQAPYASYIESLLPSPTLNYTTLVTTGPTPGTFWLPGAAGETPAQARDKMFQPAYLADVQTNDNNGLFLDAKRNDLLGWNPKSKMLLCGGVGDPTVPPAIHRDVAYADFQSRNLTNVTKVDVDAQIQARFGPGGVAPTDPTSAAFATYYGNYHGSYEPPFCHAQAKALFDTVK